MTTAVTVESVNISTTSAMQFVTVLNQCIGQLFQLAAELQPMECGTAALITAFAERQAGTALDLVQRWPA